MSKIKNNVHSYEELLVENKNLLNKLEIKNIMLNEVIQTGNHLVNATWRQRAKDKELELKHLTVIKEINETKAKLEMSEMMLNEATETSTNLVNATWRERKKLEQKITELHTTLTDLDEKNSFIEKQQKKISDSISYAKKIQTAMNPSEEQIQFAIPRSFVFYQPKDVVSGDFPYFLEIGDYIYLGAIDCTGHGVPGAMLAMIGKLILNDVITKMYENGPGFVLDMLHASVVANLKQDIPELNTNSGMDMILICLNKTNNELTFSGAHRPLILIRNNEIIEYKGSPFPIGGLQYRKRTPFTDEVIELQKGDRVYIYSDGYSDQTGGPKGQKYSSGRIKEMLLAKSKIRIEDMRQVIHDDFNDWKGDENQVDDILMIGIER
jgi:serine phosphatase RsbU (regulator of sigma subunit)